MRPTVGITCDTIQQPAAPQVRYLCWRTYADAVWGAGGNPVMLPHLVDAIDEQLRCCEAFVFTGGDDPDMTMFGQSNHPAATCMDHQRQRYELALIAALDHTHHPVLGICLGMQLLCLHHRGRLIQHLNDDALQTHRNAEHRVTRTVAGPHALPDSAIVHSHHHQAIASPGKLRVCATSGDGVIEAVDRLQTSRFYLGVQWHPERTTDTSVGRHLFDALIGAVEE